MSTVATVRFRLRDGIKDSDFHEAYRIFQEEYIATLPGFQYWEIARSPHGEWLIIVRLGNDEVAGTFFETPEARKFLDVASNDSLSTSRYQVTDHWRAPAWAPRLLSGYALPA